MYNNLTLFDFLAYVHILTALEYTIVILLININFIQIHMYIYMYM